MFCQPSDEKPGLVSNRGVPCLLSFRAGGGACLSHCSCPCRWQRERDGSHSIIPMSNVGCHGSFIEGQQIYESNVDSVTLLANPSFWSQG